LQVEEVAWKGDQPLTISLAEIQAHLHLAGEGLPATDLSATRIRGALHLGQPENGTGISWRPGATLNLRHAQMGRMLIQPHAWPDVVAMTGLVYTQLEGCSSAAERASTPVNVGCFHTWLAKQPDHSPQPYEHLASLLQKAGHKEQAEEILYMSREHERRGAQGFEYLWLTGLKYVIGIGVSTDHLHGFGRIIVQRFRIGGLSLI
jgi:hypothetical protein